MFPDRVPRRSRSSGYAGPFFHQWIWKQVCVDDHRSIHTMAWDGPATFSRCQVGCESLFTIIMWCVGGCHFTYTQIKGGTFRVHSFTVSAVCWKPLKAVWPPYRPSANGQVERHNQLVPNFLRCFLGKHQQDWDKFLPILRMSIRSMVNRNTGFTPNFLQLGWEINLPADVMLGLPVNRETSDTLADYAKQLINRLSEPYGEVRRNLKGAQRRQKTYYDRRVYPKKFNVGDLVYRKNSSVSKSQSRKLSPLFTGPYIIT